MNAKAAVRVTLIVLLVLTFISCNADITVHSHADVTELEVGDTHIGSMSRGSEVGVTVDKSGRTLVTWKVNGASESDYMRGPEDGRVWHLYESYGSFDEW